MKKVASKGADFLLIASLLGVVALVAINMLRANTTVFAQGEDFCSAAMTGETITSSIDVGVITFDAHFGEGIYDARRTSLSLIEDDRLGFAPAEKDLAACNERRVGGAPNWGYGFDGRGYEYELHGWAWNTNLGFISFACDGDIGRDFSGVDGRRLNRDGNDVSACGDIDYGVFVGMPDVNNGERELFGYAYNSIFGWIQFHASDDWPAELRRFAVTTDAIGNLGGYAWTEAGLWLPMRGAKIDLYDDEGNYYDENYLIANDPFPFPEIYPEIEEDERAEGPGFLGDAPEARPALPAGGRGGAALRDPSRWCESTYGPCVRAEPYPYASAVVAGENELRVADGADGYHVHLYLRDSDGQPLENFASNFDDFTDGISLNWTDTVKLDQTSGFESDGEFADSNRPFAEFQQAAVVYKPVTFDDFVEVDGEPGHYISREKVRSYAPTSGSNLSFSVGTDQPQAFDNEQFVLAPQDVLANEDREESILRLDSVQFDVPLLDNAANVLFEGFPVYSNGQRRLDFRFRPAFEIDRLYVNSGDDQISALRGIPFNIHFSTSFNSENDQLQAAVSEGETNVHLYYGLEDRDNANNCENRFDFNFIDENGGERGRLQFDNLELLQNERDYDFPAVGLPQLEEGEEEEIFCDFIEDPGLYSTIDYPLEGRRAVRYFSNKLPKLAGEVANPEVVVEGNLYGQAFSSLTADKITSSFSTQINVLRDRVNEAIRRNIDDYENEIDLDLPVCVIESVAGDGTIKIREDLAAACQRGTDYYLLQIGDEHVFYGLNRNWSFDLTDEDISGNWAFIVEGGNVFIESDIYDPNATTVKLTVVVLKSHDAFAHGNVYIAGGGDVKNIQAVMVLDGLLLSYGGDSYQQIDLDTGLPLWSIEERREALDYQLVLEGAFSLKNTIGGANVDASEGGRNYIIGAGGKRYPLPVTIDQRLEAMDVDLNFLRTFTLELEFDDGGLPIDQKCGKGLNTDDLIAISNGRTVCGERPGCDPAGPADQPLACDGISSQEFVLGAGGAVGDLVPPKDLEKMARGLDEQFDPVYILFKMPKRGGFLFR